LKDWVQAGGTLIASAAPFSSCRPKEQFAGDSAGELGYGDSAREAGHASRWGCCRSIPAAVPGKCCEREDFTKATQADGERRIRCTEYWRA